MKAIEPLGRFIGIIGIIINIVAVAPAPGFTATATIETAASLADHSGRPSRPRCPRPSPRPSGALWRWDSITST